MFTSIVAVSYRNESNDLETTPFSSENPYDGFKQIKRGREGRAFIKNNV